MRVSVKKNRRKAVSEILGTLIMVAITLIAGAAVFGWINGQAANSETAYGNSVSNNVNFLNERFVEVSQTFTGSGANNVCAGGTSPNLQCTGANFWVYNNGQLSFTLSSIQITNASDIPSGAANPSALNVIFYPAASSGCSGPGGLCYTGPCSSTVSGGFTMNGSPQTAIPVNQLSPNPFKISMPSAPGCSAGTQYLYDQVSYTFKFTGTYGNSYSTTLTVSG